MFVGWHFLILQGSLFITPQQEEAWDKHHWEKISSEKHKFPLILNGIYYRSDTNHWTVWINGVAISSHRPKSIQGWTIVTVSMDSVVVRSGKGETKELFIDGTSDGVGLESGQKGTSDSSQYSQENGDYELEDESEDAEDMEDMEDLEEDSPSAPAVRPQSTLPAAEKRNTEDYGAKGPDSSMDAAMPESEKTGT